MEVVVACFKNYTERIGGSHIRGYEEFYVRGYNAVQSVEKSALLASAFKLFSSLAYSSTPKMGASYSSETPVDF